MFFKIEKKTILEKFELFGGRTILRFTVSDFFIIIKKILKIFGWKIIKRRG